MILKEEGGFVDHKSGRAKFHLGLVAPTGCDEAYQSTAGPAHRIFSLTTIPVQHAIGASLERPSTKGLPSAPGDSDWLPATRENPEAGG